MSPAYNIWDVDYTYLNRRFLNMYFHCPWAMNYYKSKLRGITQRRRMIPKEDLLSLPIPVPPLPLQHQFAAKIEAIEKQKELIKRSIAEVETLLASRTQYYFG